MYRLYPLLLSLLLLATACSSSFSGANQDVRLTEDSATYVLSNGIVTARIAKASGDLVSLRYKELEMLATFLTPDGLPDLQKDPPGANPNGLNRGMTDHQYGFWSHDAMGPRGTAPAIIKVTIDPAKNGGDRAEVSVKGVAEGRKMGTGPGASPEGQFAADVEIRFTLGRGDQGIYTYCIFEHKPQYPYTQLGEARFCAKLNEFFDWMSVDANRDFHYPKDLVAGDKYIYTAPIHDNPAFGWSSTTKNVGFYIINPSMEYMSGGPTKVEFMGHRDTNPVAAACVLNYWRSSHYGGAEVNVAEGEAWTKVVGPFFIYVNSGATTAEMYADARARAPIEAEKWPYAWVSGVDYPQADKRTAVKGKLVVAGPDAKSTFTGLRVGLTAPAYLSPRPAVEPSAATGTGSAVSTTGPAATAVAPAATAVAPAGNRPRVSVTSSSGSVNASATLRITPKPPVMTDWQRDAKYYQFWTEGSSDGSFEIAKVRPGKYTLHAFADGLPGELAKADIVVEAGKPLNLGNVEWTPLRYGNVLWQIGTPNRNASEFFKGEEFANPEISLQYAHLFPDDITYTVGKSDFRKDWFFQHVPHSEDLTAKSSPFFGARTNGKATPYTVLFTLPAAPKGKATLRFAICGTGAPYVEIAVNNQPVERLTGLSGDGTITRHGRQGIWYERTVTFDASLMKAGENCLILTVPAGSVNNGMMYDFISLEVE